MSNGQTIGTSNHKAVWLEALTNFRIFEQNYENHLSSYAFLPAIDDIVVTNQKEFRNIKIVEPTMAIRLD